MDIDFNLKILSHKWKISISKQWVRFWVITIVMLAIAVVSFWGTPGIHLRLLILLGGGAVIIVLLRQPNLGFLLVLLTAMFLKYDGPSGLSGAMALVALMFGLWILDMLVVRRKFEFIRSPVMLPISVFLIVSILAFLFGQIPWFIFAHQAPLDAQVAGFAIFIFSVAGMLLAAHQIKDVYWLKIIVWCFLGLSMIYMVGRALRLDEINSLYHIGYTAQSMSWTWLVAMALSQALFNDKLSKPIKWILLSLVALTLYVGFVHNQHWKSGWVPPLVVFTILVGLRYRRLVIFTLPFILVAAVYITMDLISTEDYSWGTRVDAWKIVLEISRASPLLGMGFANYYWYTPLFPIRGWRVSFNSHSQFVDIIAETGYIGLLAFFWMVLELGRLVWRSTKLMPDGFPRAYAYGVFAGLCASILASFLGDWLLPFVYNVSLPGFRASILAWIFLGGAIALIQMYLHDPAIPEKFSHEQPT